MNHTKRFSRPVAHYPPGAVRYRLWDGSKTTMDIRCYHPPKGWSATAEQTDIHPVTGEVLPECEWWITETKDDPDDDDL